MKPWICLSTIFALGVAACSDDSTGPSSEADPETIPQEVVSWLQANAHPFSTAEAGKGLVDLEFLREMVGNARVVSLGEATHGTREFFQMKHRVLEFLVEEMGFNTFAIEATLPESNRVNDYVHTGEGDPEVLLSGLYFWTWNTREVLDMILWMREHNQDPGSGPSVSFLGFDMQYPGMAIHEVITFLETVDPTAATLATAKYACMLSFSNGPQGFAGGQARYGDQTPGYRDACLPDLQAVYDSLLAHRDEYQAASSLPAFDLVERNARVVIQYEDMASSRTPGARDLYMAENAIWALERGGPDGKIVLWAHNGHVANNPTYGTGQSMGYHLRQHFGVEMVIVGFDFYQGGFRAINRTVSGAYTGLTEHTVGAAPETSYESYFHSAGMERMILDVRGVDFGASPTSWLAGPRLMRSVGAVYTPQQPNRYFLNLSIPAWFDLVIYFDTTAAAVGLPFRYPTGWE
jgi:erythromycin esterase